jgi:hypothetical protein
MKRSLVSRSDQWAIFSLGAIAGRKALIFRVGSRRSREVRRECSFRNARLTLTFHRFAMLKQSSSVMRKLKIIRRPVVHLFLGYKLLHELRILMRLAAPSTGRSFNGIGGKPLKTS